MEETEAAWNTTEKGGDEAAAARGDGAPRNRRENGRRKGPWMPGDPKTPAGHGCGSAGGGSRLADVAAAFSAGMQRHSQRRSEGKWRRKGAARRGAIGQTMEATKGRRSPATGWTRRRGTGRWQISEGGGNRSGRHAGDAAPRTPSEMAADGRPKMRPAEEDTAHRATGAEPRTSTPRHDSVMPHGFVAARPDQMESKRGTPVLGGATPIGARERSAGCRPGASERGRLTEALPRGARAGVPCRTWGEAQPGAGTPYGCGGGTTRVTGTCQEAPVRWGKLELARGGAAQSPSPMYYVGEVLAKYRG